MTGRRNILVLVLGLSIHVSEAKPLSLAVDGNEAKPLSLAVKPLSSSGCACTSGCDKSWLKKALASSIEWCYVDTKCKAAGWDSCHDTQTLYRSAVTKKQLAEQHGAVLEAELQEVKAQLHDSELKAYTFKTQLAAELVKEAKAQNHFEQAQRQVEDVEHKAEMKIKEIQGVEHKAELKINETERKLAQAWSKEADTEKRLAEAQRKVKDAETKQNKEDEVERKRNEAEHMVKDAAIRHNEDAMKLNAAELRRADMEKKLKKVEGEAQEADQKFKGAVKAMLKLKATSKEQLAVANQKLAETQKKLESEELVESTLDDKLKEVEKEESETKKELAVTEKKRKAAVEELKPFRSAILRGVRSVAEEALTSEGAR